MLRSLVGSEMCIRDSFKDKSKKQETVRLMAQTNALTQADVATVGEHLRQVREEKEAAKCKHDQVSQEWQAELEISQLAVYELERTKALIHAGKAKALQETEQLKADAKHARKDCRLLAEEAADCTTWAEVRLVNCGMSLPEGLQPQNKTRFQEDVAMALDVAPGQVQTWEVKDGGEEPAACRPTSDPEEVAAKLADTAVRAELDKFLDSHGMSLAPEKDKPGWFKPQGAEGGDNQEVAASEDEQVEGQVRAGKESAGVKAVSYTHLTLPTKRIV
eukprot:TRINITY_DN19933_c0_g2_i2.p1 TRINITY_DN19933_c0_g2~~TRINITY_DN19933_c0_g2_i2.p1  ORF type:complete len:275 (-),score=91.49 TRINITY_DN19933_c0_g2_i2:104-928(-)